MDDLDNLPKTPDICVPSTKTESIFELTAPYSNPYQGIATKLLFVCSAGMLRSPTAADVATKKGYNARSCGSEIFYALIPISVNLIMWADKIVFMQEDNKSETYKTFANLHGFLNRDLAIIREKISAGHVWGIRDSYDRADPTLRRICKEKLDTLFDDQ